MLTFPLFKCGTDDSHGPRRVCARWPLTVSPLVHDDSSMYVCTSPPPLHACRASDRGGNIETFRGLLIHSDGGNGALHQSQRLTDYCQRHRLRCDGPHGFTVYLNMATDNFPRVVIGLASRDHHKTHHHQVKQRLSCCKMSSILR